MPNTIDGRDAGAGSGAPARDEELARREAIKRHRLTSAPGSGVIAVRPDGYIGFRCQSADAHQLAAWLTIVRCPTV